MKRFYIFLLSFMMLLGISNRANAQKASLTTSYPSYVQGDSIVFSYVSPNFSAKDKIAIYTEGTIPSAANQPIDWKYIPQSIGTITFKTNLTPRGYSAYILCCDGNDTIASRTFEIIDPSVAFVTAKTLNFAAGATLEFSYNDPSFATGDQISIYKYGEPATGTPITYSYVATKSGIASFPGVLPSGYYYAVLVSSSVAEYARSEAFNVPDQGAGSYIKTAASLYPANVTILVNYKDQNYSNKDRIGIYKKGITPSATGALSLKYITNDSSTVEVNALPFGEYTAYLLCCDGFDVKAQYDFKVVGLTTPSLVSNAISYKVGEAMEFTYNDPNVAKGGTTEWIGIYNTGDIPSAVRSIIWDYLKVSNGTFTWNVPYPNGTLPEDTPGVPLPVGEYSAYLFENDGYGVLAQISFTVVKEGTGITPEFNVSNRLELYPNPTNGLVMVKIANTDKLQGVVVYSVTGQVLYQEKLNGSVSQKTLDLKPLGKGVYFIEAQAEKYTSSKKLIIK